MITLAETGVVHPQAEAAIRGWKMHRIDPHFPKSRASRSSSSASTSIIASFRLSSNFQPPELGQNPFLIVLSQPVGDGLSQQLQETITLGKVI